MKEKLGGIIMTWEEKRDHWDRLVSEAYKRLEPIRRWVCQDLCSYEQFLQMVKRPGLYVSDYFWGVYTNLLQSPMMVAGRNLLPKQNTPAASAAARVP